MPYKNGMSMVQVIHIHVVVNGKTVSGLFPCVKLFKALSSIQHLLVVKFILLFFFYV